MARKQPVGYIVRRPLTLWGKKREIGDRLTLDDVSSIIRIESLIRSGRVNPIYDETDRGEIVKSRTGVVRDYIKKEEPKKVAPKKKAAAKPEVKDEQ